MPGTSNRGFASMAPERQREIASKGGRAAHEKGTAHEFTPEEAREAGRKGGEAVSRDRQHMAQIGAEGGRARSERASLRNQTANKDMERRQSESPDFRREENVDEGESLGRGGYIDSSETGRQGNRNR